ncbi:MAG: phospholipase [Bacteroidaceae bacterium]|nr:phospholipase [Bacteroidaceae bacterium]
MYILLIAIIILGVFSALLALISNRRDRRKVERGELPAMPADVVRKVQDMECCGQHEVCEKEEMLKALSRGVEYYDDEDLDMYRGRRADSYTDDEAEDFRDVLFTMKESDVAGWVRSLQMRGIELPPDVREEALFVLQGR